MITPAQIRAARALLGLSVDQVSALSGVSAFVIIQVEEESAASLDQSAMLALRASLEKAGIAFIADGDCPPGGMGVRLAERHDIDEGLRPENLNAANDD
ncbi:DNA-binding protein [Rhizobium sp. S-51]|uniref:DNA-binding protein n=1 Tax=Rhizobium terricola TaxID=2728849 RepID=A0A7Y0AV65_9HYPH|nr:DNA-binding protein [Rhizobium terricola]NML74076.1 DNA-binding protein [Rhizobium terricola]